jgi:hypothetical protein
MIEKTKSGSRFGIALVGAFAIIAGLGEIIVGLTGNYLGILATAFRRRLRRSL